MTLRQHIAVLRTWWRSIHPSHALEAIPAYRDAARRERRARQRNDMKAIGQARRAMREAIHADMRGAR